MSKIIDIQAAADLLAVDYKTVYRLIQSGDLPAAKIGRVYRLSQEDVERYFEKRKSVTMRELRANGHRRGAATGAENDAGGTERTCAWCGRGLVLSYSVGAHCAETGCEATICRACARNGAASRCPAHVEPGDRSARVERLRAGGVLVIGTEDLCVLARSYLREVALRLNELSGWPGDDRRAIPREDLSVAIRRRPSSEEWLALNDGSPSPFETHVAQRRVLRTRVVLFDLVLSPALHRESYARFGFDVQPCTADNLSDAMDAAGAAVRHAANAVLAFWSPTGWTERAARTAAGLSSQHRIVLVDPPADRCAGADGYVGYLLNPAGDEKALGECAAFVRDAAGANSSVRLETLVEDRGFHPEIAQRCLRQLAVTGDYVIDRFDDLGLVISRR